MRPGVCTAPEPAPERGCPSEGCQLAVLYCRRESKWEDGEMEVAGDGGGEAGEGPAPPFPGLFTLLRRRFLPPPPHPPQRPLPRPDLVQRLALVEPAVLHHVADRV